MCLAIPHNYSGGTNHRLDHATSQGRTIRLKALPHDDQTENLRARRSAGNVYTPDCEEPSNRCGCRCGLVGQWTGLGWVVWCPGRRLMPAA